MNYEEGTVGYLIEQLNKIKDKNKKVYWVETQYDDYACYGDGFTTTFYLVDGFGEEAIKDGIVLGGERIDYSKKPESVYRLRNIGTVILSQVDESMYEEDLMYEEELKPDYFCCVYEDILEGCNVFSYDSRFTKNVKVVTGHYDFKDFVVEMTPEQCYNYLRENNLGYMEEE